MEKTFELMMEPADHIMKDYGFKSYELASDVTQRSDVRGTQYGTNGPYYLEPIMYLKKAIDAAKNRLRFLQVVRQETMPEGHADIIIPKRKKYFADSSWEASMAEQATPTSQINWTAIDTMDGVKITPTNYNYGVIITRDAIRTNALNLVEYMREELSFKYENSIDSAIRDALLGTVVADGAGTGTEPTPMSDTVNGAQTIFGGDATDADNSLDNGDVITPDLILKAKRLLMSDIGYYWSSNTFTKSSVTKNPWSDSDTPFVLFIAPEQWETLMKDSQFANASEFGDRGPVLNGEIRQYAGIRIVVTEKVPSFKDGQSYTVTATETDADVNGHICGLVKSNYCGAIVWSKKAELKVFDWPVANQIRLTLNMAFGVGVIHPDAIVRIIVSDA